jgi:hypothetical protein
MPATDDGYKTDPNEFRHDFAPNLRGAEREISWHRRVRDLRLRLALIQRPTTRITADGAELGRLGRGSGSHVRPFSKLRSCVLS